MTRKCTKVCEIVNMSTAMAKCCQKKREKKTNLVLVNEDTRSRMGNVVQQDSNPNVIVCATDVLESIDRQRNDNPDEMATICQQNFT